MSEDPVPYMAGPPGPVLKLTPKRRGLGAKFSPKPVRKRRGRSTPYGPGRYALAANGRGFDCVICKSYGRTRARLPDEESARAWIDAQDTAMKFSRTPLTRNQMLDAQDALAVLPAGATLLQAAKALAKEMAVPKVPLKEARDRFLEERRHGALHDSLQGYRHNIARLCALCGDSFPVTSIKASHINQLIGHRQGVTRNHVIRHLATFFRWAVARGYAVGNPALEVPRARVSEPSRGILTVPQVAALLGQAVINRPAMIPYLALGFFAGIRPAEIERLDPAKIGKTWILIDGSVAKTSDHRTVPVRDNLRAWLDAYPPKNPITPLSTKHLYGAIRDLCAKTCELEDAAAHIQAWPKDCARHSFASYGYELTHDAALIASEMGHRGTDIFFRHYRGLVQPGDGKKYFDILPISQRKS